ncbi:DUF2062 domain-containing protein [Erythrobacter sp. LQ02-29]|uniref:DUF2062 domain-containing protein n=1 Tax=Erythrobacter sp. LQ02-29 TaxID=2920384 RepID=UPI001F4D5E91|nr:DUF2062 domain-containing protein [Erythrobacter sp. LQ02-29]MCP9222928.1 DUF2062 domain-containing protein [Erythrobacter sp. LQ02-29]
MPEREELARNRWLAPIAHRFLSPELWRFTRRSVPRGVALGLFCGFIVPIGQIFLAAFMALPARANVPLAAAVTFITNPFTFPFWVVVANRLGARVLAIDSHIGGAVLETEGFQTLRGFFEAAGVTVFGFVVLAIVSAALGYLISGLLWRVVVARRRNRRLRAMEHRLSERLAQDASE